MSRSTHAARVVVLIIAGLFTLVGVAPSAVATTGTAVHGSSTPNAGFGEGWCC